ncbi:hypothetical protein N9C27_06650 [Luminiphilus sp.]|nr:hypothetical protein [Luminiphilus sp.]
MKNSQSKPVVIAGFFVLVPILMAVTRVSAQDYIDVEAERENAAASRSMGATTAVTPIAQPSVQGGVKPYSGFTTTAVPVEANLSPENASANAGELVIQVQQLQEEVRRLNGVVEEQTAQIRRLKEQSLERYIDLDRRLAELANARAPDITSGDTAGLTFGGGGHQRPRQTP